MTKFKEVVTLLVLTFGLRHNSIAHNSHNPVKECYDLPLSSRSGLYYLDISPCTSVAAYCDFESDGGGWTVIQNRGPLLPRVNFERSWEDYKWGFGTVDKEFWWGNENIWRLTNRLDRRHELRIVIETRNGIIGEAKYSDFYLSSERDQYKLHLGSYTGTAGDYLSYHNEQRFSTFDQDNDKSSRNCASLLNGGWWYKNCAKCNLNGPGRELNSFMYDTKSNQSRINWGPNPALKNVQMMIRPHRAIQVQ